MELIKTRSRVINMGHAASVEREAGGRLHIHYAVPRATVPRGSMQAAGQSGA
jgi:hypothetical protein